MFLNSVWPLEKQWQEAKFPLNHCLIALLRCSHRQDPCISWSLHWVCPRVWPVNIDSDPSYFIPQTFPTPCSVPVLCSGQPMRIWVRYITLKKNDLHPLSSTVPSPWVNGCAGSFPCVFNLIPNIEIWQIPFHVYATESKLGLSMTQWIWETRGWGKEYDFIQETQQTKKTANQCLKITILWGLDVKFFYRKKDGGKWGNKVKMPLIL